MYVSEVVLIDPILEINRCRILKKTEQEKFETDLDILQWHLASNPIRYMEYIPSSMNIFHKADFQKILPGIHLNSALYK